MSVSQILDTPAARRWLDGRILKPAVRPRVPPDVPPSGYHPGTLGMAFEVALLSDLRHKREAAGLPVTGELLSPFRGMETAAEWARRYGTEESAAEIAGEYQVALRYMDNHRHRKDFMAFGSAAAVLGRFGNLYRARRLYQLNPNHGIGLVFQQTPESALRELQALRDIVPWEAFMGPERAIIHPEFGEGARLCRGADGDLILGDVLIDIKTTQRCSIGIGVIRQVVTYALLCNRFGINGVEDPPTIRRVGIYLARVGRLDVFDLDECMAEGAAEEILDYLVPAHMRSATDASSALH